MYDLSLIFMQIVYVIMCLEWGIIKGKEYLYTHSPTISFYRIKMIVVAAFHTIAAPISMLWDLYKS